MKRIAMIAGRYVGSIFLMGIGGAASGAGMSNPDFLMGIGGAASGVGMSNPDTAVLGIIFAIIFMGAGITSLVETIIYQVKTYGADGTTTLPR